MKCARCARTCSIRISTERWIICSGGTPSRASRNIAAQGAKGFLHQREPERIHALEVAVEGGRDHAGGAGHAAQAERVEALARLELQQHRVQ